VQTTPSDLYRVSSAKTTHDLLVTFESILVTNSFALGAGAEYSRRDGRPRSPLEWERELRRGEEDELEEEPDL
jgi:hypothetical protein